MLTDKKKERDRKTERESEREREGGRWGVEAGREHTALQFHMKSGTRATVYMCLYINIIAKSRRQHGFMVSHTTEPGNMLRTSLQFTSTPHINNRKK